MNGCALNAWAAGKKCIGSLERFLGLERNLLKPPSSHGFMSDTGSDMPGLTESDEDSSSESVRSYNDPEEQAEQSFHFACGDAKRRLVIQAFRNFHMQQGRTRRSVSGSSGRLLYDTVGLDFSVYRERVEADLPLEVRGNIDFLLRLLETHWPVQLPPNDLVFVRGLGGSDDPDKAAVQQRFQYLFFRAATELGCMESQARLLNEVLCKATKYMLYKSSTEFLVRSLPQEYRDQLLQWIADVRFQNRARVRER